MSIRKAAVIVGVGAMLAGCAAFGLTSAVVSNDTPGQLFCQVAKSDGTSMVVAAIDALVPGAVTVTGMAAVAVQLDCAAVAESVGAVSGIPVSPPADPNSVGQVAITPAPSTPAS